jgi:hypothetical protein
MNRRTFGCLVAVFLCTRSLWAQSADPLPSWNEGATKAALLKFVADVTQEGSATYVASSERIAVFDNDGTLWSEQPMYVQMAFVLDRVKELAPKNPDWKTKQPFKAVLEDDRKALSETGERGVVELIGATHMGMTSDEFHRIASDWIAKARHPKFQRPYTEMVYQPMLEVLAHLRANGFKTFIVSGGGVDFMRPWTEKIYGIPPEQVVGSMGKLKLEMKDGKPVLMRLPEVDHIDDGPAKPVGIQKFIGRRPIAAFGNSDGDLQMLQYTAAGSGPRFMLIVHHTDAEREWAYDRQSHIGKLDKALDEAKARGWVLADMKKDWKTVFSFQR